MQTKEIENITKQVAAQYKADPNCSNQLFDLSAQKDVGIVIFKMRDDVPAIIFNSTRERDNGLVEKNISALLFYMGESSRGNFVDDSDRELKFLNCGHSEIIDGEKVYFYVRAPIVPISDTTQNFRYLLVFISIGVFCATLIGSYCLSSQLALPIVRMATKAKQLNSSNTNVEFTSDEYSEVKQLSDTLNYAIGELQKTDAIRKEVIANVSHELKTPLTMIKSYTELIRDISGDYPERRKEHLDVIYAEAERLDYLINDMMDYSKLESGLMSYEKTYFNLSEVLSKFQTSFSEKHKDFKITLSTTKNVMIFADQNRIEQVITNLLNNAINYSTTKKEINIKLKKVPNDSAYKLEIIDHGIGISEENLEKIFDRHFRSSAAKRVTVGSGIGLSIVKSILTHHGFEFGAKSEENKGSTFFIIFKTTTIEEKTHA